MLEPHPFPDAIYNSLEQARLAAGQSRAAVFGDWLDYCDVVLDHRPAAEAIRNRIGQQGELLTNSDLSGVFDGPAGIPFKSVYSREEEGGWESTAALFRSALEAALRAIAAPVNGKPFVETYDLDLFGFVYQRWVHPDNPLCLTPYSAARRIAESISPDGFADVTRVFSAAIESLEHHDPYQAFFARANLKRAWEQAAQGEGEGYEETMTQGVLPLTQEYLMPVAVADPACGSGVVLLAVSARFPAFAVEQSLVTFVGYDLDPVCVKMARLNETLYGLNGHRVASLDGAPRPPSLVGSALRITDHPFARTVFPASLFPILKDAAAVANDAEALRRLAVDARRAARQEINREA